MVTSNLEWASVFGAERLTGALLNRLTHHVHIVSLNGESYRLSQSTGRRRGVKPAEAAAGAKIRVNPETAEITSTSQAERERRPWSASTPSLWPGSRPP
jgi:hypothetical protein